MKMLRVALIATSVFCSYAMADQLTMQANADIYAAGHATLPGTNNPGIFPASVSFQPALGKVLIVSGVTGMLACDFSVASGADGSCGPYDANINNTGGLSGIFVSHANMFLAGVFLDNQEPAGLGPSALQYNTGAIGSLNTTDPTFSPMLSQIFFIGDGQTGGGAGQTFKVPNGATRFFMGFAGTSSGLPSFDANDTGSLTAIFSVANATPEPPSYSLIFGAAILGITLIVRRKHGRRN